MAQLSGVQSGPKDGQLLSIQYVRAIAATSVVWWHTVQQTVLDNCAISKVGHFGDFGVDLFFVVSGFVMVFVTNKRETSPLDFLAMRVIRIAPIYWIYTLAAAATLWLLPALFTSNELSWRHLLLSLAFIPHALAKYPDQASPMVKIGWTLNEEMFFYVLFALAMFVSYRRRVALIGTALAVLVAVGVLGLGGGSAAGKFYTNDILLEFMFGMGIALLPPDFAKDFRTWHIVTLICLAVGVLILDSYHENWLRGLVRGVPAAVVVWGLLSLEQRKPLWRNGLLLELGNASYSIYLFQLYPISVFRSLAHHAGVASCRAVPVTGFVIACMTSALAGGVLSYRLIERPMLKFLHQAFGSLRPRLRPRTI